MFATKGYYSLIQYCPDASRAETANVGVVLFCPERGTLHVKMSEGNERARRLFGSNSFDASALNGAKEAIANRLAVERDRFRTLDDLQRFVDTRANALILTQPRAIRVENPAVQIEELYVELVATQQCGAHDATRPPRGRIVVTLRDEFRRLKLEDRVLRNHEVTVPVSLAILRAPFAYRNGSLNLIVPVYINAHAEAAADRLAVSADLFSRHADCGQASVAIVAALGRATSDHDIATRSKVEATLTDFNVKPFREENIGELVDLVRLEAHCS